MPLTPEEQNELDKLEYDKLLSEKGSVSSEDNAGDVPRIRPSVAAALDPAQIQEKRTDFEGLSNLGLRAGGPAIGQAAGSLTGPLSPVAVPALGGIGGVIGEVAAELHEGKQPSFGKMLSAFISGAIPGGSLAKAGVKEVA